MPQPKPAGTVHDNLRDLVAAAQSIVAHVPDAQPAKGTPRDDEQRALIKTHGGGGRQRAKLHTSLNLDAMAFVVNTGLLVSGVADLFEAGTKNDDVLTVNEQALTVLVRAPVEMAAQTLWLLDPDIDATERVRRYVMWRLSDLNSQRKLFHHADPPEAVTAVLDAKETEVLDWIESAKWTAHKRAEAGLGSPPALLDTSDPDNVRREAIPKIHELVHTITSEPVIYAAMSVPSHGDRWAVMDTLTMTDKPAPGGRKKAGVSGFALEAGWVKLLAQSAIQRPAIRLAEWNGVDQSPLREPISRLNAITFA